MGNSSSGNSNRKVPVCDCECQCNGNAPGNQTPPAPRVSGDGTPSGVTTPTLGQSGAGAGGMELKESREYSSQGTGAGGGYGRGWVNEHLPRLAFDGGDVVRESGAHNTEYFLPAGAGYVGEFFVKSTLTKDRVANKYIVTKPDGEKEIYNKDGVIERKTDAYGNDVVYTYSSGELVSVVIGSGATEVGYYYFFNSLGLMDQVVMNVGGQEYRRIDYRYTDSGDLERAELDEKDGTGWEEIETAYYRYHSGGKKLLRFVLGDHAYEQMKSVDPTWPEAATDAQVARYADTEYDYYRDGSVKVVKTNGGKYVYQLSYVNSAHSGSTMNVWSSKVVVRMPDGSTNTYYYNWAGSLLLKKVSEPQVDASVKEWYPICQQFDGNARMVLSATSSAVKVVDESMPRLFVLKAHGGQIGEIEYDAFGNELSRGVRHGTAGVVVAQQENTYESKTVGGVTIYVVRTSTEYPDATATGASNPVTTIFDYVWYKKGAKNTFQMKKKTTTLPAVSNAENGDGATGTVIEKYDRYGFLIQSIDAVGTKTNYDYELMTGAMVKMVEDAGAGRLNLTTEYTVDPLGRTILTKGAAHTISLDGTATLIRRAQWTQYLDADDEVRTVKGYIKVSGGTEHTVNPVLISRHFVDDPQVRGGRMQESIAAFYTGSGLPPETPTAFSQSEYVRWSTEHFDKRNEQTHSRVYHCIPESGLGSKGTDFAQTNYGYDSAGRQNRTKSPQGTISSTVFNAMSWLMRARIGTTDVNLVTTTENTYDGGLGGGDGNLTTVRNLVDGTPENDQVTEFRYDWRNRQTKVIANDGTRKLINRRTYDNLGNVIQTDEYQTSVKAKNLINRAESFFDARNRQYRTKRYGVTVGTGALQPALTSETYYDQADRLVRNTPAGKVGFTVTRYDAIGRTPKMFRAWGGTLDYADPGAIDDATVVEQSELAYDKGGNSISTTIRQRFDDAVGFGELKSPTVEPKARVSYTANYPDALGRTVANANYGTNAGGAWTRSSTIPPRTDEVLVSSFVFNDAGEQEESTDPMGTVTQREFDAAGRMVKLIENYQP